MTNRRGHEKERREKGEERREKGEWEDKWMRRENNIFFAWTNWYNGPIGTVKQIVRTVIRHF